MEFSSVYVKKHSDVQVEELRAQQGSIHLVPCPDRSNVASYAFVEIGAAFIDQLDGEGLVIGSGMPSPVGPREVLLLYRLYRWYP